MYKKLMLAAVCVSSLAAALSGCAPLIVSGAAVAGTTAVTTMNDRRSAGAVLNDAVLEKRISWEIGQALGKAVDSHITVTAYNGKVLLTGEIATTQAKKTAGEVARKSLDVASVVNELAVMPNVGMTQRLSDSTLATKVRSRLVGTEDVYLSQMKVVVDRGIVYLMGIVTSQENNLALTVAARTSGVNRVISVCDVMSAKRIQQHLRDIRKAQESSEQLEEAQQ